MSASKNTSATMKKPFCKVCFDAGKDSAHPLRNAAGQTLCPYLLSLICKNCRKSGHTVKYCNVPERFNAPSNERTRRPIQEKPIQEKSKQKTPFEIMAQLISEEEKQEVARELEDLERRRQETLRQTNFPHISSVRGSSKKISDSILTGWNTVAGKTVKVYETLPEEASHEEETQQPAKPILVQEKDEAEAEYKDEDEEDEKNKEDVTQALPSYCNTYSRWADYE